MANDKKLCISWPRSKIFFIQHRRRAPVPTAAVKICFRRKNIKALPPYATGKKTFPFSVGIGLQEVRQGHKYLTKIFKMAMLQRR